MTTNSQDGLREALNRLAETKRQLEAGWELEDKLDELISLTRTQALRDAAEAIRAWWDRKYSKEPAAPGLVAMSVGEAEGLAAAVEALAAAEHGAATQEGG